MNKHKTAQVSQVDAEDSTLNISELCKQNDKLQTQNNSLEDKLDALKLEMKQMIAAAITQSTIELNKIDSETKQTVNTGQQKASRFTDHRSFRVQNNKDRINPRWELNQFGVPIICNKCGWKGHKADNCRGSIQCNHCKERGHAITICPKISKNKQPKNS